LPSECIYSGSVDSVLLKLIVLPSVTRELALSTTVSTGSLRGEEHTENASDSPPSKSSSMIARVMIEEEGCTIKGEGKLKNLLAHPLAYFAYLGIEPSILRLTTSLKGLRLLLFDY
jgi:hypothetical protein